MRSLRGTSAGCSPVSAASRSNRQDIDYLFARSSIKEDAPLADAEAPEALRTAEVFDVAVGKLADCQADSLTVLPAQLAEGLQGGGADLNPPSARVSQRLAPPRSPTKKCLARSALP